MAKPAVRIVLALAVVGVLVSASVLMLRKGSSERNPTAVGAAPKVNDASAAKASQTSAAKAMRAPRPLRPAWSDRPTPAEVGMEWLALEPALDRVAAAVADHGGNWDELSRAAAKDAGPGSREKEAVGEIPPFRRWEIYFPEGITVPLYARQLDYFGIELGVIGNPPGQIQYASHLSKPIPDKRTAAADAEARLYLSWQRGNLTEADRQLMAAAGIEVSDKIVVQFCPTDVENKLAEAERQFAGRAPGAILRTRFGVRQAGDGYEFFVIDQAPLR